MRVRRIHLIVNPAAGRRRATALAARARVALSRVGKVFEVQSFHPGHEAQLAADAVTRGSDAIVVLGGDGSLSHAARGIVSSGARIPIAVLAAGTGNDFAKSIGAPVYDFDATASLIGDDVTRIIDAGSVDGNVFINSAGFGFDAEVLAHTLQPGMLHGTPRYVTTALRHLFGYRGFEASLLLDGKIATARSHSWLTVVFANGQWFGGTFQIAPEARVDDGVLDCIAIGDASPLKRASLFAAALRGAHVRSDAVHVARGARFTMQFRAPPRYQIDGELMQAEGTRVVIAIIPRALTLVAR